MALPGSGTITMEMIRAEFGGGYPISLSQYYRNGGLVTSNNTNVPTSGAISLSNFYGAQKLQYFPDSFYINGMYLYTSYINVYFYATVTVAHLSTATFSGASSNVTLEALTNPASIGTTTNSSGVPCEYFDFYIQTRRGCMNGNDQTRYQTMRMRALSGGYENYLVSDSFSQTGC